ncbi:hypothetical protein C8Q72DRAFT_265426 [Fomitopsis betulina]|nr:hypothetical protein C8Q72DRAFT_265426 [Fomitopsis betulina]
MSYHPTAPALMSLPFTLGAPCIDSPDKDHDDPTEGGHTFSSVNHTQQTQSEFDSSPPPDETSDGMLQHLVEHIKAWKLLKDVFGTLLDEQEFPILEDWEEICKIDEDQWEDVRAFGNKESSILQFFSLNHSRMPSICAHFTRSSARTTTTLSWRGMHDQMCLMAFMISIWQDLAVVETASSKTTESVVSMIVR